MGRRQFAALLGAGSVLVAGGPRWLAGCGSYAAEEGVAYAPWDFPERGASPERIAVHGALLASSPHNTQPWLFVVNEREIDLFADVRKSLGAMDSTHREMHIGLGCAIENLVIAAAGAGRRANVTLMPDAGDETHVARVALEPSEPVGGALYRAIARRHTNRGAYLDGDPPGALEGAIRGLIDDPDIELTYLHGSKKGVFREGTIAATEAIVDDTEMNEASHAWWRQTKEDIEAHRDGLTVDATGLGSTTRYLAKQTGKPSASKAGEYWIDSTKGDHTTAFAYCILSCAERGSREQQMRVGRVYQRIHLWATGEGLAMHPLNQMTERQDREQERGLRGEFGSRLAGLTGQSESRAQMLFRIGVAWDDALKSPRRPIAWVLK